MFERIKNYLSMCSCMDTLSNLDLRPIHISRDRLGETLSRMNPLLMESYDIGLILLTDSDGGGKQIRAFLSGLAPRDF